MIKTSSLSRLLVRPHLKHDEWVETYIGRVARANGTARPWRHDIERIRPLLPVAAGSTLRGLVRWGEKVPPEWAVRGRAAKVKYCPACFSEDRYIRSRWRLSFMDVCTVHGLRLKDNFAEPAFTGYYKNPGKIVLSLATEEEIWEGAVCPMPWELRHIRRLWQEFEQAVIEGRVREINKHLACALLIERILNALAHAHRGPNAAQAGLERSTHRAEIVRRMNIEVNASLEGILEFLKYISWTSYRGAAQRCLRQILHEEGQLGTIMAHIPIVDFLDRMNAEVSQKMGVARSGALPKRLHPHGYLSQVAAVFEIGCSSSLFDMLTRVNLLQSVQKLRYGRNTYVFVSKQEVAFCKNWYRSLMLARDVKFELKVGARAYDLIVGAGLLLPWKFNGCVWYKRSSVNCLLGRLDDVAGPFPDSEVKLFPLFGDWMFKNGWSRDVLIRLVKEFFEGVVPIFKSLEKSGVEAYFINIETVRRLRRSGDMYYHLSSKRSKFDHQLSLL